MPKQTTNITPDSEYIKHHEYDAWRFIQKSAKTVETCLSKNNVSSDVLNTGNADAYKAPELFESDARITEATYVWTLGAKAYNLLTGTPPFGSQGGKLLQKHKEAIDLSGHFSPQINSLINRCLSAEPWKRPSIADIIETSKTMMEKIDKNIIADRKEEAKPNPEVTKPEVKPETNPKPKFTKRFTKGFIEAIMIISSIVTIYLFLQPYLKKKNFESAKTTEVAQTDSTKPTNTPSQKTKHNDDTKNNSVSNSTDVNALLDDANRFFNSGKYQAAIDKYKAYIQEAISLNFPSESTLSQQKRISDSEECLKIIDKADLLFENQEYDEAMKEYDKILKINQLDSYAKNQKKICEQKNSAL